MTGGPGAVLVLGEALVDLVPAADDLLRADDGLLPADEDLLRAQPGGAPANVAVGLARLGTPVCFAGGLGGDAFARTIERWLAGAGVDVSLCGRSSLPTALAVADPGESGTSYRFHLQDTATFRLPERAADAARFGAVYVGGLAAVVEPAAEVVYATARAAARHGLLAVDPNVREDRGLDRLRELCELAHVVKASDEDLARLWPDADPDESGRRLAAGGRLVVLTRGARGSTAYAPGISPVSAAAAPVSVVNTIGAGDAFMAAVLGWLGRGGRWDLALTEERAGEMLEFASGVAASVVGRSGTERGVGVGVGVRVRW
ncbi:PfkB family carbohydrate kinase [Streptomyces sp. NPDC051907]|uniref:PfkB family carbohydrate kinase n=1 Tax=Streptomyces sp. NPDC051907 TaxID=3155284 RepID=UPI003418E662